MKFYFTFIRISYILPFFYCFHSYTLVNYLCNIAQIKQTYTSAVDIDREVFLEKKKSFQSVSFMFYHNKSQLIHRPTENTLQYNPCVNPKTELNQMKFGPYSSDCHPLKEMPVLNTAP